ncbi:MAG: sigma-70 family RNA polymerase sigma factor [Bacteroidota bacterium]
MNNKEKILIENCRKGKRKSEKQLYEHFFGYAMSIALRYSQNYDEAIEILNDSFIKVFKKIKDYNDLSFKGWLRRIVINTASDHYRKNKKHLYHKNIDSNEALTVVDTETIDDQISYEELLEAVQQLPPSYRNTFCMYVIDGYKHEEIAEMLNVSVGTSKSNLHRARAFLRDLILKRDYAVA